jgi:hypothetical protein
MNKTEGKKTTIRRYLIEGSQRKGVIIDTQQINALSLCCVTFYLLCSHYVECRYPECRGAVFAQNFTHTYAI